MKTQRISLHLRIWSGPPGKGRLIVDRSARSILGNFLGLLACQIAQTGIYCSLVDYVGAPFTPGFNEFNFRGLGSAGVVQQGIVVGTGVTPVALADYHLAAVIASGNGAGQLSYQATSCSVVGKGASAWDYAILRTFVNNSPGSITVTECGLHVYAHSSHYCLIIRDLTGGIAVAVGKILTIEYTIRVPLL